MAFAPGRKSYKTNVLLSIKYNEKAEHILLRAPKPCIDYKELIYLQIASNAL